jgi:hypothetical protein
MNEAANSLANPGLLGRVLVWLRARVGPADELTMMSREELRELASDLALGENDLVALSASLHDNTALMEQTIRARGFDPEQLRGSFGLLMRDVELVCSRCHATGRCQRELTAGTAVEHAHEFCPNAGTFDDLVEYVTSG